MIDFTKPQLTTTPVNIPPGGVFCITDSGARLNKAATPDFNTRVSQCHEATMVMRLSFYRSVIILYKIDSFE